jgi:hypothetical protein
VTLLVAVLAAAGCGSTLQHQRDASGQPVILPTSGDLTPTPFHGIPATGHGWDRTTIHIGVITENDAEAVAKSIGLANLDPGDQEADARAAAAEINAAGGVYGRKIVLEFWNEPTFALLASPDSEAAGACTHFTQDLDVVAVVNDVSIIDTPNFKNCFATNHLPVFEGSQQPTDTKALNGYGGYVIAVLSPSYTDLAPTLVARLKALGYFTGWDTTKGAPGTAPVRVGILTPHDPTGTEAARLVTDALIAAGYPPVDTYSYSASGAGSGTESSAAFQFHAKGITHVIGTGLNTYLFMTPAEAQGYHPRYGVSSFNGPGPLLQTNEPPGQLVGSLGVGVDPTADVDLAHDPGIVSPAERSCLKTMTAAGQHFGARRLAEAVGLFDCDSFRLFKVAALAGNGLTPDAIVRGVQIGGPDFVPAETFTSGLGPGRFALAGSARDLGWVTECGCYQYLSRHNHPIGAG